MSVNITIHFITSYKTEPIIKKELKKERSFLYSVPQDSFFSLKKNPSSLLPLTINPSRLILLTITPYGHWKIFERILTSKLGRIY
jgi:hypothetical protein